MNETLESFLNSLQLQQYHDMFIKAGATDQDLPQLIQFNDQELTEFLSALDMLPFHCIKFKKAVRELKVSLEQQKQTYDNHNDSMDITAVSINKHASATPSTRAFIESHAIIYGKKKNRPLTSYEEAINRASLQLALENPLLISKKGDLFDLAKKKLLEDGYQYKRGSSRSKLKEDHSFSIANKTCSSVANDAEAQQHQQILIKRQENAQRMSDKRLQKIESLQQQVDDAIKCRQTTENQLSNGVRRDQLTQLALEAEMIRYEEIKVKLNKEISKLKAQERKHRWYKRRKLERSASQSTDEGFSSQQSNQDNSQFSVYESCSQSSYSTYPSSSSSQEYNHKEEDAHIVSHRTNDSMTTNTICCSRESDVRASSISNYDR